MESDGNGDDSNKDGIKEKERSDQVNNVENGNSWKVEEEQTITKVGREEDEYSLNVPENSHDVSRKNVQGDKDSGNNEKDNK